MWTDFVYAALSAVMTQISWLALEQGIEVTNIDSGTDPQLEQVPLYATGNIAAARKVAGLLAKEIGPQGGEIAFLPFQLGERHERRSGQGFQAGSQEVSKAEACRRADDSSRLQHRTERD